MPAQPKFVIFAHHATYDTLHQVATLGLTAAAMGKDVIVIFLFWTIKKLAEGKIDQVDFPRSMPTRPTKWRGFKRKEGAEDFGNVSGCKTRREVSPDRLQCRIGIHGRGQLRRRKEVEKSWACPQFLR